MNKDLEHLRWLSIGYYVYAGVTALFFCFPFIHVFVGIAMVSGAFEGDKNPPPPFVGWMFIGVGGLFIILGWALAICSFIVGKYLKQQTHYIFCLVIAGINCMFAPFGTVLGVFTIIVLLRDSVKQLFNGQKVSTESYTPQNWQ